MSFASSTLRATRIGMMGLSALAALAISDTALADTPASCHYIKLATLNVAVTDMAPTIEGSINNSSASMLIDSGASNTLLTMVEKTKLGLATTATANTHKKSKSAADDRTQLSELAIGPIEFGATHILTLSSLADHANYGALVGADILFQHDMELTLHDKQVNFFKPDNCDGKILSYWDSNAAAVPLDQLSATDHRQMVTVEINGQKLRALIDTATPISVINLSAAARLGVTPQTPGVKPVSKTTGTQTAAAKVWIAPFEHFAIGDETIKNVKIPIADLRESGNAGSTPDMLLGADFLNAHHLLFAISQHQLYFSYLGGTVFGADTAPKTAGN